MKVTVDMGNMSEIVETAIEKNLEAIIKEQVEEAVKKSIDRVVEDAIDDAVSKNYQRFVDEYIKNTKIKVGGGLWGDREIKEYTVEEYINHELQKCMNEKTLTVSDRYGNDKKMSFERYLRKSSHSIPMKHQPLLIKRSKIKLKKKEKISKLQYV